MGPRPLGRGNRPDDLVAQAVPVAASMGPRPLGRGNHRGWQTRSQCSHRFNGATSSRTWKLQRGRWIVRRDMKLQWGHVLSDVETLRPSPLCPIHRRFNGATSSRTWKPPRWNLWPAKTNVASMGPRPLGRGNELSRFVVSLETLALQWGHVLSDVETFPNWRKSPWVPMLQWGHVLSDVETERAGGVCASADKALQWGHVLSDVETS